MPGSQNQKFWSAASHKSRTHNSTQLCFMEERPVGTVRRQGWGWARTASLPVRPPLLKSACQSPEHERRTQSLKQESWGEERLRARYLGKSVSLSMVYGQGSGWERMGASRTVQLWLVCCLRRWPIQDFRSLFYIVIADSRSNQLLGDFRVSYSVRSMCHSPRSHGSTSGGQTEPPHDYCVKCNSSSSVLACPDS